MYRAPTPPPPVDPRETAKDAVKACAGLQLGIVVLTAITFAIVILRMAFGWHAPSEPAQVEEVRGAMVKWSLIGGGVMTLVFGAWGGLNFWGVRRFAPWARWSSIVFAIVSIGMCCYAPFSGFLLYLLFRADVKAAFAPRAP
jgi:formate hydrogenlyase subunit 3/multisubunit Na+/H+ antiporter MnhD subunit